jgi:7-carboxy-7-deazaguanine synthase
MRGSNPKRGVESGDGKMLAVKHIFATIQGEGPYAGVPAVFVRLGGCNLACDFCDTQFEDFESIALDIILERVNALAGPRRLVVITGGEPMRQPIGPLCEALLAAGYKVQIETNGTLFRPLPEKVEIVCSPKNTGGGYFPLREDLLARVNALKFLISHDRADYNHVPDVGQKDGVAIYVQPMDEYDEEKNRRNLQYAAEVAMKRGYRLSLQTHKIVGIE